MDYPVTTQLTSQQVTADRRAEATLIGAVAIGCLASIVRLLTEDALTSVAVSFVWGLLPPALILAAALIAAPAERKAGIARQGGALLVLAGLAAFSVPFTVSLPFSPIYGTALILLAVRTRYSTTAVVGGVALVGSLVVGSVNVPQAVFALAVLAVACVANAVRVWSAARSS